MTDRYALRHLPAGPVHGIIWHWSGYEVAGAATVDRRGNRHLYEVRGKELVALKDEPQSWRPADVNRWRWPNNVAPEPLPVQIEPRMTTIGMAFDATAAAAEMEADREAARANRRAATTDTPQWWRDVARVAYAPMGAVSRDHGEARIMRALILERGIRLDLRPYRTNAAVLADLKATLADLLAEAPASDWVPPLVAQPEDWRDFEVVMGWLIEVMPSRRELTCLRGRMQSPPLTWVQIGDEIGRTEARARQLYAGAIDALVAAANREPRRARARLAELQERNRSAAR